MTDRELLELIAAKVGSLDLAVATQQADINTLRENVLTKQGLVLLENKIDKNFKALYDGYEQTYEKVTLLESKLERVIDNIDKQDMEIKVLKGKRSW